MKQSINEIAEKLNGRVSGNGDHIITGAAGLDDASATEISFLKDPKRANRLDQTKAGAVIVPEGVSHQNLNLITVQNPLKCFTEILVLLEKEKLAPKREQHPSSIVHPTVKVGKNVAIGPLTVIEEGAVIEDDVVLGPQCYVGPNTTIGKNTRLYPQVVLRENVRVGANCILHSGAVIGSDGYGYFFDGSQHRKIPQIGTVVLEDNVEIGSGTTIDRATTGETRIGRGTKIDNLVQVAHNVKIGANSLLVAQVGIAGSCELAEGVVLGGQVGVADHIKIGKGAQIAAQSGLRENVPDGAILFGTPARPIQETIKQHILIQKLPRLFQDFKKIKETIGNNGGNKKTTNN